MHDVHRVLLVQTVNSVVHLVPMRPGVTTNRHIANVSLDGLGSYAMNRVHRELMELNAIVSAPAKMVEHVII